MREQVRIWLVLYMASGLAVLQNQELTLNSTYNATLIITFTAGSKGENGSHKEGEYDLEISKSQTADQPTAQ